MKVNVFLRSHHQEIINIINSFGQTEFSSHDFIEKLSQRFQTEYIQILSEYDHTGKPFQTVHRLIARYLSSNKAIFSITKAPKKSSENVFGNRDIIQWWGKI